MVSVTHHPPLHHQKKSSCGFFWMGWNPTPGTLLWGGFLFSFLFFFLPPHPWPATVSSKNNPATYPFPATYPTQTLSLPGFRASLLLEKLRHVPRSSIALQKFCCAPECPPHSSEVLLSPSLEEGKWGTNNQKTQLGTMHGPQAHHQVFR